MAEAMRVLRMGRTKMYELAAEWRITGGASGLEVLQFGTSLRVPRVALERLIGGPVHVPSEPAVSPSSPAEVAPVAPQLVVHSNPNPIPASPPNAKRTRARATRPSSQLGLFDPPSAS